VIKGKSDSHLWGVNILLSLDQVLYGAEFALEVFCLLPGKDPTVDSSLDNNGLFRFPGGEWTVVNSIGQLDIGDVVSFVVGVLDTILPFLDHLRRLDVEIPSWSAASLDIWIDMVDMHDSAFD